MLRLLWRIFFVYPARVQKWIDRIFVLLTVAAFIARCLRSVIPARRRGTKKDSPA